MQTQYYKNADNFFALFDADTFDREMVSTNDGGLVWQGWVNNGGWLATAAEFVYSDSSKTSGKGWWDDTLI